MRFQDQLISPVREDDVRKSFIGLTLSDNNLALLVVLPLGWESGSSAGTSTLSPAVPAGYGAMHGERNSTWRHHLQREMVRW